MPVIDTIKSLATKFRSGTELGTSSNKVKAFLDKLLGSGKWKFINYGTSKGNLEPAGQIKPSVLVKVIKELSDKAYKAVDAGDGVKKWGLVAGKLGGSKVALVDVIDKATGKSGVGLFAVQIPLLKTKTASVRRNRVAAIAARVAYITDGFTLPDGGTVTADDFRKHDLVGVSGHLVGNQIFDNAGTGNVKHIDSKANRIWVLVHQDEQSVPSAPTVFRPEELFLMHRTGDEDVNPAVFAVPEMKELVESPGVLE